MDFFFGMVKQVVWTVFALVSMAWTTCSQHYFRLTFSHIFESIYQDCDQKRTGNYFYLED